MGRNAGGRTGGGVSLDGADRGDIWLVDLDPIRGHEQSGTRPALVISVDALNYGPAGLLVVLPVTSRARNIRWHDPVSPPEGGLSLHSYIKCEDVRSVPKQRLIRRMGSTSARTRAAVEYRLRILMGL